MISYFNILFLPFYYNTSYCSSPFGIRTSANPLIHCRIYWSNTDMIFSIFNSINYSRRQGTVPCLLFIVERVECTPHPPWNGPPSPQGEGLSCRVGKGIFPHTVYILNTISPAFPLRGRCQHLLTDEVFTCLKQTFAQGTPQAHIKPSVVILSAARHPTVPCLMFYSNSLIIFSCLYSFAKSNAVLPSPVFMDLSAPLFNNSLTIPSCPI